MMKRGREGAFGTKETDNMGTISVVGSALCNVERGFHRERKEETEKPSMRGKAYWEQMILFCANEY